MTRAHLVIAILSSLILIAACGRQTPLDALKSDLASVPEYSILLEDMNEEGTFFPEYYHRYKVVTANYTASDTSFDSYLTDWQRVREDQYVQYENNLGMVIASRGEEGELSESGYPPGYQYVGDSRYGQWRTDGNGSTFWEFYGKYAMLQTVFGMMSGPVYRGDWDDYRTNRRNNRPYYGSRNQYGTGGAQTKKTNPTFFQRRQQREASSRKSFSDRVQERTRRSNMSKTRTRSSKGFGK